MQLSKGVLHIQRQVQRIPNQGWSFVEPKTKAGKRRVKVWPGVLQSLQDHRNRQELQKLFTGERWKENDLIFPSSVGTAGYPSNLRIDFNNVLARAGISKIRFHDLRHTAASLMLNHNVPVIVVSNILGHSKPSITLDVYGHLIHDMQGEASEIMGKLVTPVRIEMPAEVVRSTKF